MSNGRFPFRYRVRRTDKRTYWQFGSAEDAIGYMQSKIGSAPVLSDEAYLCKIEPDGSEGDVIGWFRPLGPLGGDGVRYEAVVIGGSRDIPL